MSSRTSLSSSCRGDSVNCLVRGTFFRVSTSQAASRGDNQVLLRHLNQHQPEWAETPHIAPPIDTPKCRAVRLLGTSLQSTRQDQEADRRQQHDPAEQTVQCPGDRWVDSDQECDRQAANGVDGTVCHRRR